MHQLTERKSNEETDRNKQEIQIVHALFPVLDHDHYLFGNNYNWFFQKDLLPNVF